MMTREEAISILDKEFNIGNNSSIVSDYNERFIRRLEALGLLKFEDSKYYCFMCVKAVTTPCNECLEKKDNNLLKATAYDPSFKEASDRINELGNFKSELVVKPEKSSIKTVIKAYYVYADNLIDALLKHNYKIVDCDLHNVVDKRQPKIKSIEYGDWLHNMRNACLCFLGETVGRNGQQSLDKKKLADYVNDVKKAVDEWPQVI